MAGSCLTPADIQEIPRGNPARHPEQGLEQTLEYQDRSGAPEAHLVILDRDPAKPWAEETSKRVETRGGKSVTVWGM